MRAQATQHLSNICAAIDNRETVSFYDALNDRIGIDDNGTQEWTVYDGTNPYADFNGSGTLEERYQSGPGMVDGAAVDELLARTSASSVTAWYLTDKLGSVRDIASSSGGELDHVIYDSFGNIVTETHASEGDRFKFAGMEYDPAIGQYYDQARWYAPETGRFSVQDPTGFSAGDPNLQRYVGNDPTDLVDPSGLQPPQGPGPASSKPGSQSNISTQQQAAEQAQKVREAQQVEKQAQQRVAKAKAELAAQRDYIAWAEELEANGVIKLSEIEHGIMELELTKLSFELTLRENVLRAAEMARFQIENKSQLARDGWISLQLQKLKGIETLRADLERQEGERYANIGTHPTEDEMEKMAKQRADEAKKRVDDLQAQIEANRKKDQRMHP